MQINKRELEDLFFSRVCALGEAGLDFDLGQGEFENIRVKIERTLRRLKKLKNRLKSADIGAKRSGKISKEALEKKIKDTQTKINAIKKEMDGIRKKLLTLNKSIQYVEESIQNMEHKIESYRAENEITKAKNLSEALKAERLKYLRMSKQIEELKTQLKREEELELLEDKLDELKETYEIDFGSKDPKKVLHERIAILETEIAELFFDFGMEIYRIRPKEKELYSYYADIIEVKELLKGVG